MVIDGLAVELSGLVEIDLLFRKIITESSLAWMGWNSNFESFVLIQILLKELSSKIRWRYISDFLNIIFSLDSDHFLIFLI